MRALITGGAGFIGSHIADALLAKGLEVRVLDSLLAPVHRGKPEYLSEEIEFIQGDATNRDDLRAALRDVDFVFHQAAYQGFLPDFSTFFHTNTVSTALLFELVVGEKLPVQKVIVASSQAVYGEGKYQCGCVGVRVCGCKGNPGSETAETSGKQSKIVNICYPPPRLLEQLRRRDWEVKCPDCRQPMQWLPTDEAVVTPTTSYQMSKYTEEMIAFNLGRRHGIPATCFRYSITQGPRQSFYNAYSGVLRIFALRLLSDRPPVVYEDGLMQRDYVHVRDVVAANLLSLEDSRTDFEAYNVGSGVATTVLEYADRVARRLGKDLKPMFPGEFRFGDTRHIVSDVSKLRSLGWQPTAALDDIINDYVNWIETQDDLKDYFEEAEKVLKSTGAVRKA